MKKVLYTAFAALTLITPFAYAMQNGYDSDSEASNSDTAPKLRWCKCGKAPKTLRLQLVDKIDQKLQETHPNPETPISIISFAAGTGLKQEHHLVQKLAATHKKIQLHLIDIAYCAGAPTENIHTIIEAAKENGTEVTVEVYRTHHEYLGYLDYLIASKKAGPADILFAVDVEVTPESIINPTLGVIPFGLEYVEKAIVGIKESPAAGKATIVSFFLDEDKAKKEPNSPDVQVSIFSPQEVIFQYKQGFPDTYEGCARWIRHFKKNPPKEVYRTQTVNEIANYWMMLFNCTDSYTVKTANNRAIDHFAYLSETLHAHNPALQVYTLMVKSLREGPPIKRSCLEGEYKTINLCE